MQGVQVDGGFQYVRFSYQRSINGAKVSLLSLKTTENEHGSIEKTNLILRRSLLLLRLVRLLLGRHDDGFFSRSRHLKNRSKNTKCAVGVN